MSDPTSTSRRVAACEQCGAVFAARVRSDGRIYPIGTPRSCPCGGDEYRLVE